MFVCNAYIRDDDSCIAVETFGNYIFLPLILASEVSLLPSRMYIRSMHVYVFVHVCALLQIIRIHT